MLPSESQDLSSTELVPGDIIEIPREGCTMFCDAVLLKGNCILNESTLTGEGVPVTKIPFLSTSQIGQTGDKEVDEEHFDLKAASRSVLFCGTIVIQTRNYADQPVLAVVVRTGFRTAKGEMVRSILYPKPMKFKFQQDVKRFIIALICLATVGFALSIYVLVSSISPRLFAF